MKMDIQIPFIFVSLFSLASVLLIFIYKFGIKEKSYEEALAEQRQQTHILFGVKSKSKDKKNKKTSKKVKDKATVENDAAEDVDQSETIQSENPEDDSKKPHLEFKELADDNNLPSKKQAKKEKVRPILVQKAKNENELNNPKQSIIIPTNHFEELHPKDEFELLRSEEDLIKEGEEQKSTSKPFKVEVEVQKPFLKKQPEVVAPVTQKENHIPIATASLNGFIGNTGKEKKKKKSEFNTLQQLAGYSSGPNMPVLLNLVRNAELSRSEVQILIDLLLNKQHEAPAILEDWSEGKADPVQKLKKQLAEREKTLLEEQQTVASAQSKLREIRSEHQNEKSVLQQKIRSLDEMCQGKQVEASRLHQQLQQLQAQIKEELLKNHKLREEQAAVQMQRQEIEIRLAQAQESEVHINQLQNEFQEVSAHNGHLRLELQRVTDEYGAEKEHHKTVIELLTKDLEQLTDHNQRLEENRVDLEHRFDEVFKKEKNLKIELNHVHGVAQQQKEEIWRLQHIETQYQDDLQKYKNDSEALIDQLKSDLQTLKAENVHIQTAHVNGSLQESKQREIEILNLHNELTSLKNTLNQTEHQATAELEACNVNIKKLQYEIKELEKKLDEETSKLEEQRVKNNDLRTKNWKVMEALNAAESKIKNNVTNISSEKSDTDVQKEFIQRLFPEIKELQSINSDAFETDSAKCVRKYIDDLRPQNNDEEIQQLKSQLQHYRNVIDNAERMLNKLQKHIEQEEINWRMQLAAKTAELESLKECHALELQEKLTRLETEFQKGQEIKEERTTIHFQENKSDSPSGLSILEAQNCNSANGVQ